MGRIGMCRVLAAIAVGAAGLLAATPSSAAAPHLSVPSTANAGDAVEVIVTDCDGTATAAWFPAYDDSSPTPIAMSAGPGPGQQHGSFAAPEADVVVDARCDGLPVSSDDGSGRIDVATTETPTLVVGPEHPAPGDQITLTVTGCAGEASGFTSYTDILLPLLFTAAGPDTWEASVAAGDDDQWFSVHCPGWFGVDSLTVDIENPVLRWGPYTPLGGFHDPLTTLTGTDCPLGATPDIEFSTAAGDSWTVATGSVSDTGGWSVPLPDFSALSAKTEVTASATCGSVTYDPITAPFGQAATSTTTTTTTTPDAAPADAVAGAPDYTG